MSTVVVGLTTSLDGFIAGPNDGPGNPLGDGGGRLFDWWSAGTERIGPDDRFKPPARSVPVVREMFECGAIITGRSTFDGERTIAVGAADVAQQYLKAGLLDEIHINLVPVLLGDGVRLFANLEDQVDLECTRVVESDGVTHLRYRVNE